MATQLTLSQAFTGFKIYQTAVGRSPRTIESYDSTFKKLAEFLDGNPAIAAITRRNIVHFLLHLQTDYTTVPMASPRDRVSSSRPRPSTTSTSTSVHSGPGQSKRTTSTPTSSGPSTSPSSRHPSSSPSARIRSVRCSRPASTPTSGRTGKPARAG